MGCRNHWAILKRSMSLIAAAALTLAVASLLFMGLPLLSPSEHANRNENLRLDTYNPQAWAGANAVEPYITTSANGTVYAAWIGVREIQPTEYLNSSTSFDSEIWFATSTNHGRSFSAPVQVSAETEGVDYFDPSIAVSDQGGVFITYVSESTNSTGQG